MYLIASTTKLGDDVARQKFGVAACYVYVSILNAEQAVEHFLESRNQLYFVEKNIVQVIINHLGFDVSVECEWLSEFCIFDVIECYLDDVVFEHSIGNQMLLEKRKE